MTRTTDLKQKNLFLKPIKYKIWINNQDSQATFPRIFILNRL